MDEALIGLLVEKDFEFVTVKEICERAEVSRSTFYLHYRTLGDLLDECMEGTMRSFLTTFDGIRPDFAAEIGVGPRVSLATITLEFVIPYLSFVKGNLPVFRAYIERPRAMKTDMVFIAPLQRCDRPRPGEVRGAAEGVELPGGLLPDGHRSHSAEMGAKRLRGRCGARGEADMRLRPSRRRRSRRGKGRWRMRKLAPGTACTQKPFGANPSRMMRPLGGMPAWATRSKKAAIAGAFATLALSLANGMLAAAGGSAWFALLAGAYAVLGAMRVPAIIRLSGTWRPKGPSCAPHLRHRHCCAASDSGGDGAYARGRVARHRARRDPHDSHGDLRVRRVGVRDSRRRESPETWDGGSRRVSRLLVRRGGDLHAVAPALHGGDFRRGWRIIRLRYGCMLRRRSLPRGAPPGRLRHQGDPCRQ